MEVERRELPGVMVIRPKVHVDGRGFFVETWRQREYEELGIGPFVQDNQSRSRRGVVRGIHFQRRYPQGKLVHVARGRILDVVVELRRQAPWAGQVVAVELGEGEQIWVPAGYGHAFCVLSEEADVLYRCTDVWHPEDAGGVRWDDPELGIRWPVEGVIVSEADRALPLWRDVRVG